MTFNHRKSVTYRLVQAARVQRTRAAVHLSRIGLHPGQEAVLKALADKDGQSMSELAAELAVQPPTVTKMISRLGIQGLLVRQTSAADGRLARVYLTEAGRERATQVDAIWKKVEKEALAGLEDKDRKRLKKLLRQIEKNLAPASAAVQQADDDEEDVALVTPEAPAQTATKVEAVTEEVAAGE
ncbi:MarR family winged helix-turn-helix transcriptional regulator [Oryzibacter oryziterrae]|uniref:MarR family winged helix-turn-helix transcriptional regulator n=1 Tax=Oryzibacter oryziterrae TaxID=2766474 RepID=UPI001F2C1059|nr:MarR family winged helix-turn-helix transcriptional regulator [Oryzibacter oryziterrae]